jgi:hypothetical protein
MHHVIRCFILHAKVSISLIQIPDILTSRILLIPGIGNQHCDPDKRNGFSRNSSNTQPKRGFWGFYGFFRPLELFFFAVTPGYPSDLDGHF